MKHKISITLLLLGMFVVTQFIGIAVLNEYAPTTNEYYNETTGQYDTITEREQLPFGMEYEEEQGPAGTLLTIITSLIFAILIYAFLMRHDLRLIIRVWFMLVIFLALCLTSYPFIAKYTVNPSIIAGLIAIPLVYFKVIKPNVYVHNITELLIYPGIAVVVVALLYLPSNETASIFISIALLLLISLYDAWAVWKSGVMQKMAQYQMEQLNIFGGFLIPTMSKKEKEKIRALKAKYKKDKKMSKKDTKKKFKVNLAILGGGDVIFPIITAGIFMWAFPEQALFGIKGLIPALFIIGGATAGLLYLFINTQKGKAYPAMPYISTGIFIGMALWKILIY
jgi:presenilin-like A22 family membrane protease